VNRKLAAGIVAGGTLVSVLTTKKILDRTGYTVAQVVDGDTFITKEDQMIRLAAIDAPEMGRCGSVEAKNYLEKIIKGKPVYLKIVYREKYNRLIAFVYTDEGSVNQRVLAAGLAVWSGYQNENDPDLGPVAKSARNNKVGIFSESCTQTINKSKPKCQIKANFRKNQMLYRFPGCGQYNNTQVQLFLGDQWFCSEKEAKAAGFTKGSDCFNKEN
jgi:micrococcal nuclease